MLKPSTLKFNNMARWLIIAGIVLIIIGLILWLAPWLVNWFGKLPGDIRIEKENSKVFIPITSMILISILLTIIVNVIRMLK
jgi:H+/Cl- antiporter ClcA